MGHMSIGGLDILGIYKNKKIGQISVIGIVGILHNVGYKVFAICRHQCIVPIHFTNNAPNTFAASKCTGK